tara:strand:+ start:2130 stop:2330 length:201 start_codon:yes stop_codon:yes gene_type:complete
MGIHYDYKSTKSAKLMEKQAKREKKLAEKKAKRLAKEGTKSENRKSNTLDTSEPITLDFLTNPNKK